jgi:hypothetical protein
MRSLVSYDDIAPHHGTSTQLTSPLPSTTKPPAKKRRTSNPAQKRAALQHRRELCGSPHVLNNGENAHGTNGIDDEGEDEDMEEEESRELTREEIWDDSALIEAWDSATAEYEVRDSEGILAAILTPRQFWIGLSW